jgi:bifunctional DNA-binding transcriptional regulator/antitoxin component of YhaV-PrlF toxin-antitoxin module
MRFHATLELGGKTATGIHVPDDVVAALGSSRRPPVRVTLGQHTYRTTVARMGGRYLVPVSAEVREAAGVAAGDELDVQIELDTEPRVVAMPDDLALALDGCPGARERFERLSYTHRKEHVRAIEEAKTEATRQRRIAKAVAAVTASGRETPGP